MAYRIDKIRTEKSQWNELIDMMADWFRIKAVTNDQNQRIYDRIKSYPYPCIKWAVEKIIDERRPTSSYWPTINEITNLCENWLINKPEIKFAMTVFDHEEDHEYPIQKLIDAFVILDREGRPAFFEFTEKNRMPKADIARVIGKAQASRNIEPILKSIGGMSDEKKHRRNV